MYMYKIMFSSISYLDHGVILVLTSTVISIQGNDGFSKTVLVKEVVYKAYHGVGTFARDQSLVNEVVYLNCSQKKIHVIVL